MLPKDDEQEMLSKARLSVQLCRNLPKCFLTPTMALHNKCENPGKTASQAEELRIPSGLNHFQRVVEATTLNPGPPVL